MSKTLIVPNAVRILSSLAPLELAGSWDNVGLLVEPSEKKPITHITLTIDLTEPVLEEAIAAGSQMVIAYHPPIFVPLKRLTQNAVKERIVVKAIEKGIAIYSPHTALDATTGGINDWLASGLGELQACEILEPQKESGGNGGYKFSATVASEAAAAALAAKLTEAGAKNASFFECVRPGAEKSYRVEATGSLQSFAAVTTTATGNGADESKALVSNYEITQLQSVPSTVRGQGRRAVLKEPVPLATIVERVKQHLNMKTVRLAVAEGKDVNTHMVQSVAICAGSGGSVISKVKADVYWTGEMGHHDVLAAIAKGTSVILCEHTNTERGYLKVFRERLLSAMRQAGIDPLPTIYIAERDADPLVTV